MSVPGLFERFAQWEAWLLESQDYRNVVASFANVRVPLPPQLGTEPTKRVMVAEIFASYVETGVYPPKEILIDVANRLRAYLNAAGSKTLDEAFDFKSAPSSGNPAKQLASQRIMAELMFLIAWKRSSQHLTLSKAIEQVREGPGSHLSHESLLRYYRKNSRGKKLEELIQRDLLNR